MNKRDLGDAFVARVTDGLSRKDVLDGITGGKIASVILTRRCELGMEQGEFAQHMGVSRETVSGWESGEWDFTISELCGICEKLLLVFDVSFTREQDGPA